MNRTMSISSCNNHLALAEAIASVMGAVADPRNGLPEPIFELALKLTPMVNVDLLVKDGEGRTLLAWREDRFGAGWHIPGGIIRYGEHSGQRIDFVAREELGASVEPDLLPCDILQYVGRRGHFISLLYRCRLIGDFELPTLFHSGDGTPRHGAIGWIKGLPQSLYPSHEQYASWLVHDRRFDPAGPKEHD
jgi:ADP-ribose pyrophosphatase YjhB (NUDIX family)